MKLLPTVALIAAAALATGLYQRGQLRDLRAQEEALVADRDALEDGLAQRVTKTTAEAPAEATAPAEANEGFDRADWVSRLSAVVDREPRDESRILLLYDELSTAPLEDVRKLLDDVHSGAISLRLPLPNALLAILTERAPFYAVQFIVENSDVKHYHGILTNAAVNWSLEDPGGAVTWFKNREAAGDFRDKPQRFLRNLELALLTGATVQDPGSIPIGPVAQVTEEHVLTRFIENVSAGLTTNRDRRVFARRLAELTGEQRQRVLNALGKSWSQQYSFPEASALMDSLGRGDEGVWHPLYYWTAVNSHDATMAERFDWFVGDVEGHKRRNLTVSLVSRWAQSDFNGTANFLKEMAPSRDRDFAVDIFAKTIAEVEPPSAVDWALDIRDADIKRGALEDIYEDWSQEDPAAARAYFAEKGLDPGRFAGN